MKKKLLSVVLTLTVALTMCFASVPAYAASGTAIKTADDLKAMESNPGGSYYLANDIEVPANLILFTSYDAPFTGTLDGNGHTIKGYTYTSSADWTEQAALFGYAKKATFKNLKMTNVNISLNQAGTVAALIAASENCKFTDISVSGKITGKSLSTAAGIVAYSYEGGTLTNCKNSADITITNADEGSSAAGVAGFIGSAGSMKNCSNSGKISISGSIEAASISAAGVVLNVGKATSCKNSGAISVSAIGKGSMNDECVAAGVAVEADTAVSCSNTGKVSMNAAVEAVHPHRVGGVFGAVTKSASKCYNKGAVSFSGKSHRGLYVGGLGAYLPKVSQSYNKGAVTVKMSSVMKTEENKIGGVCGDTVDMRNCYNTGSVTVTGKAFVGGISGYAHPWGEKVVNNYNTGKVKASTKGTFKGQVIGGYEGAEMVQKRNIYDNYYTGSGKAYGWGFVTWHKWVAKASKVSSIKAANCPKLSSKYWTYSSKYGRMILKNNKEK